MRELETQITPLDENVRRLLSSLPADHSWYRGLINESDIQHFMHIYHPSWARLSGGSGRVMDSARTIAFLEEIHGQDQAQIEKIHKLARNFSFVSGSPLIACANDLQQGPFLLLDGNHRASALLLRRLWHAEAPQHKLTIFVAVSASQPIWQWNP